MAFKKVDSFEREVKFTRPGPKLGQFTPDSFVGEFVIIPTTTLTELRARPGGLKDPEYVRLALRRVVTEGITVDDVVDDAIAVPATVMEHQKAIAEGANGKNSET